MSANQQFPRVHGLIADLCAKNKNIHEIFEKLEFALEEQERLRKSKNMLKKDIDNMQIDLMLIRQATELANERQEESSNILQILETSHSRLLKIVDFLNDDRINNMLRYSILSKQNEVQAELNQLEQHQQNDLQCKTAMENRKIVKEFRKWQQLLKESEEEYLSITLEIEQLKAQWKIKIDAATQRRNKKIVSLVQLSKQIVDLQTEKHSFKVPKPFGVKSASSDVVKVTRSAPLVLQTAMEFLSKFKIDSTAAKGVVQPLRPILISNRLSEDADNKQTSPSKQVHFAPMPSPSPSPVLVDDNSSQVPFENKFQEISEDDVNNKAVTAPLEFDQSHLPERPSPSPFPVQVDDNSSQVPFGNKFQEISEDDINRSNLPERPVIENVEILPPLNLYFDNDDVAFDVPDSSKANNASKSEKNLSFKNIFSSIDSVQDNFDAKPSMGHDELQLSEQSMDNSESNNINESNNLNFAAPEMDCNNEFFLNFDDNDDSGNLQNTYQL